MRTYTSKVASDTGLVTSITGPIALSTSSIETMQKTGVSESGERASRSFADTNINGSGTATPSKGD